MGHQEPRRGWRHECAAGLNLPGQELVIGIRPEGLRPSKKRGSLEIELLLVEELGSDTFVYGTRSADVDGKQLIARRGKSARPAKGDLVVLTADPEAVLFFDPLSGRA